MVNWLSMEISNAAGEVTYRNSFITDLDVTRDNAAELAAAGRTRWKTENETFNVLKIKGNNLEHHFGHGEQNLPAVLAILNLLAFACHAVCDLARQVEIRTAGRRHSQAVFLSATGYEGEEGVFGGCLTSAIPHVI